MKIMVYGTGAMGSIYAGLFADNTQHEVWAVDIWQDHINAINDQGLRVEGASGDRLIKTIHATTKASEAGACDLYIIATKASGVAAAAKEIATLMDDNSLVVTIQNGLGAAERIAEHMPTDNVLLGVAQGFGATMRSPGHVYHSSMSLIRLGELQGGITDRLNNITVVWQTVGFEAQAYEDIQQLIWEKYICNVTFSAPCTAFDCTLGELMADAQKWKIALGCAEEVYRLGQKKEINFSFADPVAYVTKFGNAMPDARPSMLLDHHAKRKSEIDAINGMAAELGQSLGIATPYNETLTAIIHNIENTF